MKNKFHCVFTVMMNFQFALMMKKFINVSWLEPLILHFDANAFSTKVVCLLGMNDGFHWRNIPPIRFDLMAENLFVETENADDDRYLFLEALNSASKQLYVSYIGLSIRDNQPCNPSVLVTELIDYICQSFCLVGDETLTIDESAKRLVSIWSSIMSPIRKRKFLA